MSQRQVGPPLVLVLAEAVASTAWGYPRTHAPPVIRMVRNVMMMRVVCNVMISVAAHSPRVSTGNLAENMGVGKQRDCFDISQTSSCVRF